MATCIFRGDAPAVAQVQAWVFGGTWEANDVITATINGKAVSMVTGGTDIATFLALFVTALNASTIPEFAEVTWSQSTTTLIGTADTAGKPFTATMSTTETGGGGADSQTIDGTTSSTGTSTTACSGPNFWNVAGNWSGGAVPVNSDDVIVENTSTSILYGLDNNSVTLTSLSVRKTFTGTIGLPKINGTGSSAYYEYRETYLKVSATTVNIGDGEGNGSGRIKLNTGTNAATVNVKGTGSTEETSLPSFLWVGAHASNVANIYSGTTGIAALAGETATVPVIRISVAPNQAGDAVVICGSGATLTTINKAGGTLTLNGAATTITQTGGETTINGTGAITTLTMRDSGRVTYNTSGTLTTLYIAGQADTEIDFTKDMRSKTVTTANRYGYATIRDTFKVVTFTNGVDNEGTDITGLVLGSNLNIQRAAVS